MVVLLHVVSERRIEPWSALTTTQKQKAPFGAFCFWSRMNRGIEAASGTDAGGESDKHECLRTHACLGASERMQARARPARPIPAGSTNHKPPTLLSWGFFLVTIANACVKLRHQAKSCGPRRSAHRGPYRGYSLGFPPFPESPGAT